LFWAIKQFTAWGQWEASNYLNFTPGAVMVLFTVCVLFLCRRDFKQYGLTLTGWPTALKLGMSWGLVLVAGATLLRLLGVRHEPGMAPPTLSEGLIYGTAALAAVALLARLVARHSTVSNRIPAAATAVLLLVLLGAPLLVAMYHHRPFPNTLLTIAWLVFGAACGEELFYRGYIQSRLNAAFGRPHRFLGINFGVELLVSSFLFGFLHALNSVDYFQGHFTFAWDFVSVPLARACYMDASVKPPEML